MRQLLGTHIIRYNLLICELQLMHKIADAEQHTILNGTYIRQHKKICSIYEIS